MNLFGKSTFCNDILCKIVGIPEKTAIILLETSIVVNFSDGPEPKPRLSYFLGAWSQILKKGLGLIQAQA